MYLGLCISFYGQVTNFRVRYLHSGTRGEHRCMTSHYKVEVSRSSLPLTLDMTKGSVFKNILGGSIFRKSFQGQSVYGLFINKLNYNDALGLTAPKVRVRK